MAGGATDDSESDDTSLDNTDAAAVLAVNTAFYEAHEGRDMDAMAAVWHHDEQVMCVHPGWPILRGWADVCASWERILSGPGTNQFILTNASVTVVGNAAWVSVDENMISDSGTGVATATNIFARTPADNGGEWKMVAHHAGPVMT